MAQISIIQKSDITEAGRFDAEYFKPEYLEIEKKLKSKDYQYFDDFLFITDGIHNSIDFDENSNILLFSAKAPKENAFNISGLKKISKKQHLENPRTALQEGDVIISTVGTIGNCAVITKNLLPANSDRHVGILRTKNIPPFFLSTFLLSKYGRMQSNRNIVGNVQPNLYIRDMKKFIIPNFSKHFQLQIEKIVKEAHQKQSESKQLYAEAENLLLAELDLLDYQPQHQLTFDTIKKEVDQAGRFDAEYFHPNALKLRKIFENTNSIKVKNAITYSLVSGSTPKSKGDGYEINGKIKFIRAVNLSNLEIDYSGVLCIKNEIHNKMLKRSQLQTGDVLFSIAGVIGRCAVVADDIEQANINQALAIIRLDKKIFNPYYVALFFNSKLGNQYVNDISRPVAQTNLNLTELSNVYIPLLPLETQQQIAQKITQSHQLRTESKDLLELAKLKVEQAIES